ncbi:hypothetical protein JCM3765_004218 [Sporobolomyces pararoseus]
MAQTTTTTLLQPPPLSIQASVTPSIPTGIGSCHHLNEWINLQTPHQTFERLRLLTSYSLTLKPSSNHQTRPLPPPSCSTCSQSSLRPFVCLSCATTSCGSALSTSTSHAQNHFKKQNHSLAWDLRSETLFCFPCQSYVTTKGIDRLKLNMKFQQMDDFEKPFEPVTAGGPLKKRKRRHGNELHPENFSLQSNVTNVVVPARGIRNLGNSCYMSVILQSFFLNPFLRAYFLSDRHNRSLCQRALRGETCLSCEVDGLFSEYYSSTPNEALAPTKFLHAFWSSSFEALGYAQQDAHEFLISALNLLHSHSPSPTDNPLKTCPCIIHNTFSGRTRSQISCGRCGHQSETFEMFLDLSLDVRDRGAGRDLGRLEDCLKSFTTAEKLPAKYDCAACGNPPEQASKRLSITALPQVLCVQLKRFEHTSLAGGGGGAKIDTFVQFPLELDMTPYLSSIIDYPTLANKSPTSQNRYNLLSVVAHEGSLSQGHYTTYARGTDDFFHIDDEKVRRCGLKEVQNSKAYLLVYSRI